MNSVQTINPTEGEAITSADLLRQAKSPGRGSLLERMSVGIDFVTDFWRDKYLREYIRQGGSKIKFVTGQGGSGKTHLLELMSVIAEKENYVTTHFSACDIWMHDFREIYLEIFRQSDIAECLQGCARRVVAEMGYDYSEIAPGMTFMDYLSQHGQADGITKKEIRNQLKDMFLENPLIDNNFALACSLITGGILGHPLLEEQNKDLLLAWLDGDKSVKLAALRALGLSPSRITKFNARHMLRSLAEVIRLAGYSGLFITIDNLEILVNRSSLQPIRYTKLRREDTYESIRQLVDEIDSLKNIMFVFAFDRELLDNDNAGIKSYQALWMRIQNEIIGERFNRFTDIADLDRLAAQEYTPEIVMEMSKRLSDLCREENIYASPITMEQAQRLIDQAKVGSVSLPRLINRETLGGRA